jgi:RimJ/RimL family protein N-acetyltransferase
MDRDFSLRDVLEADLPIFFAYELDPDARAMAAFTSKDPANREAFMAHWHQILADPTTIIRTIVVDGQVAGSVLSYHDDGHPEVTYWLGKHFWGKGLATRALSEFLAHANRLARSMHAQPKTISARYGSWKNAGSGLSARAEGSPMHAARRLRSSSSNSTNAAVSGS